MTITLTRPVRIGGVELAAATTQTLSADIEADLVARGSATPAGLPPGVAGAGANLLAQLAEIGMPLKFPGFEPSLLPSLVTSSTASRASGVVTVAANAHGITTGSAYVGYRIFYPGSPSLAAGWYDSILSVTTNAITFFAPGADFGSESVNAGAAYTTLTSVCDLIIPANALREGSRITANICRDGDATTTKNIRPMINGSIFGVCSGISTFSGTHRMSAYCANGIMRTSTSQDGVLATSTNTLAVNLAANIEYAISASVSAAAGFSVIASAMLEVVQ